MCIRDRYLSARYARNLGLPLVEVQHHHAHIASVMAEHGRQKDVIGLACDGTGYGEDGAVWGCEFMKAGLDGFERLGHLRYVRLPGGDAAVKDADRSAYSHMVEAFGGEDDLPPTDVLERLGEKKLSVLRQMVARGVNSPWTSSLGRLFDAASAIAGVVHTAHYEAQPAIEFEAAAASGIEEAYPFEVAGKGDAFIIDPRPMIRRLALDAAAATPKGVMSARFHNGVAAFLAEAARFARDRTGLGVVALSGGVFQNEYLLKRLYRLLRANGFRVLVHREVPANDGCIALGQAAVAAERVRRGLLKLE